MTVITLLEKAAMLNRLIPGLLLRRFKSRRGQTLVEYALVLAFISVLTIVFMSALGVEIQGLYLPIISALSAVRESI